MLEEVDRLTRLVESLLVLSRADASHVQLHRADTSLLSVAEEAASTLEVLAEEKRQKIDVEGDGDLVVSADRLILRQAIVNLLDNAIKYSPVESRILIRVHPGEDKKACLDVVDRGPEFRPNISPTSSTDSIGLTKHAPVNGAAPAWGCPSPVGQSKLIVARYPYPAKAVTDARFESVYPLRATFRAKRRVA
jgi:hypothetical protein